MWWMAGLLAQLEPLSLEPLDPPSKADALDNIRFLEPDPAPGVLALDASKKKLRQIISEATPRTKDSKSFPAFPKTENGTARWRVGREDERVDVVTLESSFFEARGQYLVVVFKKVGDELPFFTDVIAEVTEERSFRRWRLLPDGGVARMVGEPDLWLEQKQAGMEDAPKLLPMQRILWSGSIDGGAEAGMQIVGREDVRALGGRGLGDQMRWRHIVTTDDRLVGRASLSVTGEFKPQPEEEEVPQPKGLGGMLASIFGNKEQPAKEQPKPLKEERFEALNFSFTPPSRRFQKIDPKHMNSEAILTYIRSSPSRSLMIIAEDPGPAVRLDRTALANLAQARLKGLVENAIVSELSDHTVNGLTFSAFTSEAKIGGKLNVWCHLVTENNGFLYQIMTTGLGRDTDRLKKDALEYAEGFAIIDADRISLGAGLKGLSVIKKYEEPRLGLSLDLAKEGAQVWPEQMRKLDFPLAAFGAVVPTGGGLVVVPVDLGEFDPTDDALHYGLLTALGVNYPDDVTVSEEHQQGAASGVRMTCEIIGANGNPYTYRILILRNGRMAFMMGGFALKGDEQCMAKVDRMIATAEVVAAKPDYQEDGVEPFEDANTLNEIGIHYHGLGNFMEAADYFVASSRRSPKDRQIFENAIQTLIDSGRAAEGLKFFEVSSAEFGNQLAVQAYLPKLLSSIGRPEESVEKYDELFSAGLRDEDHLLAYIGTLIELNRGEKAVEVIDTFIGDGSAATLRVRRWQHQVHSQQGDTAKALQLAGKMAAEFPNNPQLKLDLVAAQLDDERADEALKLITVIRKESGPSAGLAYQEGRAMLIKRNYRKAKEALEAAKQMAPANAEIMEALSMASALLGQGDNSAIKQPLKEVAIPSELTKALAEVTPESEKEGFSSWVRNSVTGFHYKKGAALRRTEHLIIEIYNRAGVEENKTQRFDFDPTYQRIFINRMEVLDMQGKVIAKAKVDDFYVTSGRGGEAMATSESTLFVPVPGLKPGTVLRYSVTTEDRGTSEQFQFENFFFASAARPGPRAIFLTGDHGSVDAIARNGEFIEQQQDGQRYWIVAEPPKFHFEAQQPALTELFPQLALGSGKQTWPQIGNEYLEHIADRLEPTEKVKKLAQELVADAKDEAEKIETLLGWVRDELSYQAIEFGTRALTPNRSPQILSNRYGDCKDHSLLAHQLLNAVGIESHLALVSTDTNMLRELPSLDQFDHMILYLPGGGGGTYYDATAKDQVLSLAAASNLANHDVLLLDSSGPRLQKIQPLKAGENFVRSRRSALLKSESGDLVVNESIELRGLPAGGIRNYMRSLDKEDRRSSLQMMIAGREKMKIEKVEFKDLEDLTQPLGIELTYRIEGFSKSRKARAGLQLPAIWESFYFDRGYAADERHNPFQIKQPMVLESEMTFRAEGETAASVWKPEVIESPWVNAELKFKDPKKRGSGARCRIELQPGTYGAEDYSVYLEDLELYLDTIRGSLTLEGS